MVMWRREQLIKLFLNIIISLLNKHHHAGGFAQRTKMRLGFKNHLGSSTGVGSNVFCVSASGGLVKLVLTVSPVEGHPPVPCLGLRVSGFLKLDLVKVAVFQIPLWNAHFFYSGCLNGSSTPEPEVAPPEWLSVARYCPWKTQVQISISA